MRHRKVFISAAVFSICALALPVIAEQTRTATSFTFDGFQLGNDFATKVMARAPYQHPCDDDPVANGAQRVVIYAGRECRGQTFPSSTTVVFFLAHAEGDSRFAQPIQAMAWMGGNYFEQNNRSDFPARLNQPVAAVDRILGQPARTFSLGPATVRVHAGDIYSVALEGRVKVYIVGPMPDEPQAEQWEAVVEMYQEFAAPRRRR